MALNLGYRHGQKFYKGNLYSEIRKRTGWTREVMGEAIGCTADSLKYRERMKAMYHLKEVVGLWELSGMSADDYMKLLKDIS